MKTKTLAALALVAALGASPAWAAEVVSSNIVGYDKVSLTANAYDILGLQFTGVNGATIDIQSLFGAGVEDGDNVLFFDGTGYKSYTYADVTFDEDWNELAAGWQDDDTGFRAERTVTAGEAFWILPVGTKDVTFAGEVSTTNTYTFVGSGENQLVTIPVPMEVDLQNVSFDNIADGDSIQVFTGNGYKSFTYADVTFDEDWNELEAGWQDDDTGFRASNQMNLGKGFWINASASSIDIGL